MLREQEFEEVEHGMTVWEREELFAAWRDELKDGRNNAGCVTVEEETKLGCEIWRLGCKELERESDREGGTGSGRLGTEVGSDQGRAQSWKNVSKIYSPSTQYI